MADAWETLLDKSALSPGHDSWEHLNAQEGGGGGGTIIMGEVEVDVEQPLISIDVISAVSVNAHDPDVVIVNVDDAVSIETETEEITVETCK